MPSKICKIVSLFTLNVNKNIIFMEANETFKSFNQSRKPCCPKVMVILVNVFRIGQRFEMKVF